MRNGIEEDSLDVFAILLVFVPFGHVVEVLRLPPRRGRPLLCLSFFSGG